MRSLLAAVLVVALAGCDSSAPPAFSDLVTDEAQLPIGESAVVDGVAVTFVDVEEDSRCPDTATCVWQGRAVVALTLDGRPFSVRVVDPDAAPEAGVRVGDRVVFATALVPLPVLDPSADVTPIVTVATVPA